MFVALVAAFGVLMTPDDLADTAAMSGLTDAVSVSSSALESFDASTMPA